MSKQLSRLPKRAIRRSLAVLNSPTNSILRPFGGSQLLPSSSQSANELRELSSTSSSAAHPKQFRRFSSTWTGRGQDFLGDSFLGHGLDRPKVLLEAMGPSGFDVSNLIKKIDPNEMAPHGALHMTGSILAFPNACFLWRIQDPCEITIEALSPVLLHRPKIEYIFIGTAKPMDRHQLDQLKNDMKERGNIVLEWLPLAEAMSTFNILNGEDRMVATALVLDKDESHYVKDED